MSVEYPDLADYLAIGAAVTGTELRAISNATKLDLADSALHPPSASFGDEEFYPDFCDKAGVLPVRLAKNHPLLAGNKRMTWVTLRLFIEMNSWRWTTYPPVDEAEQAVLAVATGEWDEHRTGQPPGCGSASRRHPLRRRRRGSTPPHALAGSKRPRGYRASGPALGSRPTSYDRDSKRPGGARRPLSVTASS